MSNVSSVVKGIGAGMAAGLAVGVAGAAMVNSSSSGRKLKKSSKKAIQAVENLLDDARMKLK